MQIGPRIRFDKHTLGNLVKNVSPIVGGLVGGPAGFAVAGGLSAIGDKARGKDISISNALTNASLAGGASALKGHFMPGASPTIGAPGAGATDVVTHGGLSLPTAPNLTTAATHAIDPRSFIDKAVDVGGDVLGFAEKHPNTIAAGLNAVGGLSTAGAQNRTANAQADLLEKQAEESEYDFQRRKARDLALAPVWSALGEGVGGGYAGVAANPYLPTGG